MRKPFAIYAITVHGVGIAARLRDALPAADLYVSEKLFGRAPEGALRLPLPLSPTLARTFAGYDCHIFVISVGAVVRMIAPLLAATFLALMRWFQRHHADGPTFLCSCGLICALLASTAIGLYPYVLLSVPHPERSLTVVNTAAPPGALFTAAIWMIPGAMLLVIYQVFVYRTFRGKVVLGPGTHY